MRRCVICQKEIKDNEIANYIFGGYSHPACDDDQLEKIDKSLSKNSKEARVV